MLLDSFWHNKATSEREMYRSLLLWSNVLVLSLERHNMFSVASSMLMLNARIFERKHTHNQRISADGCVCGGTCALVILRSLAKASTQRQARAETYFWMKLSPDWPFRQWRHCNRPHKHIRTIFWIGYVIISDFRYERTKVNDIHTIANRTGHWENKGSFFGGKTHRMR